MERRLGGGHSHSPCSRKADGRDGSPYGVCDGYRLVYVRTARLVCELRLGRTRIGLGHLLVDEQHWVGFRSIIDLKLLFQVLLCYFNTHVVKQKSKE